MIKLRADWQQTCPSCGTELVIDFMHQCPKDYICPWCGAKVQISICDGVQKVRDKLTEELGNLEACINTEIDSSSN